MKSLDATPYVALLSAMLNDLSIACRTSMERDLMTIKSRFEHEGLSFLTITLPAFGKCFEQALEEGQIDPTKFAGFKAASKVPFPAFLQGLVGQVFTSEGVLQDAPNPDAVEGIRQICLAFNKIKLECTLGRRKAAEKQFLATEREVSGFRLARYEQHEVFARVARLLFGNIFGCLSNKLDSLQIVPRHGPGSTYDKTYGNRKYLDKRWTMRLQKTFPFDWYKTFNPNESFELSSQSEGVGYEEIPRREEPPVRVVFVPKTMKSPRVIAIEPVWTQEVQQGLMREFVELLETDKVTKGHVNFSDQGINRNLAFNSSKSRAFATIDLSEASDRVHPSLVAQMFKSFPSLSRAVFSCRSERAILPSGIEISLKKFASQGSALCFPVEAMVFYSIVVSALLKHRNLPLTFRSVRNCARDAFVYGDDIIVPNAEVSVVIEQLEAAGLKVNRKKTFSKGYFRESCGMDAFMGVNVTPVYFRHPLPSSTRDADKIVGSVSTANLLYKKGYWKTAALLRSLIEEVTGVVPHVPDDSSVMGWHSVQQVASVHRWNRGLHRFEVKGAKLKISKVKDPLDGYRAMHKWSTTRAGKVRIIMADEPLSANSFVSRDVRGRTRLSYRWASSM